MQVTRIKLMTDIRRTPGKLAVLRLLKLSDDPLSAADIRRRLGSQAGRAASTLFRILKSYQQSGEIAAIESEDGVTRYVGHVWHEAQFRCARCGRRRHLKHRSLPGYVDRKMFGHQEIIATQLIAQGLCASCARKRSS